MIIRIAKRPRGWTVISNETLQDERLSYKATGLLAYLLSMPDDWRVNREDLADRKTDGVAAVRSALNELDSAGYLVRRRKRLSNGTFETTLEVHERPVPDAKTARPEAGNRAADDSTAVKQPLLLSTQTEDPDLEETPASQPAESDLGLPGREKPKAPRAIVADAVWEARAMKPAGGWIAVAKLAEKFLGAGVDPERLTRAMIEAPVVSQGAVELQLSRGAPRGAARAGTWSEEQQSGPVRLGEWSDD